ncbi:MAG: NADH-quinone oxidoreductase subunit L [Myxococcales bacterium]|nr:NADH-quinone oxidoreductase subunit L [Myxococcales bacterium]
MIPLLPLAGAFLNLFVWRLLAPLTGKYRQSDSLTHTTAIASVLGAFGLACYLVGVPLWKQYSAWHALGDARPETMGGLHQHLWTWIEVGSLKIDLAFRLDTLTAVMLLVITGIGSLIHIYSVGYMHGEKRYPAFFGYLNLFTGMMLILVLGDSLPIMFIGWEGVGLCSYLLIGFWFEETANADAGRKAFVANRVGDFAFLLGICLLFYATGSVDFADLQRPESIDALKEVFWGGERMGFYIALLFFIGACGKSAQIPLYVWLPDAMAGPTPVSALIHAATMVTAGVYMIVRMSFLYAHSTTAMAIVAVVGALTALFAAIMAFAQTDLKKVLAYSTVSQLGFMFVGVGVGAYTAGVFHLITHAFFKAGLFLAAGSVMHAMSGSGDIMKMGGLRKYMPRTRWSFLIYCVAIAGIFPFSGFFSKDEILAGAFGAGAEGWGPVLGKFLWATLSIAALGTAFYMFRLYFLVFGGELRCDEETKSHIHESPYSMTVPLMILAAFTCVIGVIGFPHLLDDKKELILPTYLHDWLSSTVVDFGRESLLMANGTSSIPESHLSNTLTIGLMIGAFAIGLIGIFTAKAIYGRGPSEKVAAMCETGNGKAIHNVVLNKFYVDELYEWSLYRFFRGAAKTLHEVVDRFLIDGLVVNGSAWLIDRGSRGLQLFQNGQLHRYLVGVVVGGALIFYFASSPKVSFDYKQLNANEVEFTPDFSSLTTIRGGLDAKGATITFDLDSDGEADFTSEYHPQKPMKVKWTFGGAGKYKVSMTMTDAVFDEKYSVTRTITVKDLAVKGGVK